MDPLSVSRKDFLRTAGSVALFAALGISFPACNVSDSNDGGGTRPPTIPPNSPAITISGNTVTVNMDDPSTRGLKDAGGWLLISAASVLVVNVDGTVIRAFTSVCTHAGCATNWTFGNNVFECTCHGSRFNTSGQVVRGPAATDLQEFAVQRNGDMVTITKS